MNLKKIAAMTLSAVMLFTVAGCGSGKTNEGGGDTPASGNSDGGGSNNAASTDMKVAMITDYGDITDRSFNQTTYEAGKKFCDSNGIGFNYYKPEGDSTAERVAMVDKAAADGYNVLLLPGYTFAEAIVETCDTYPDIKFVGLDIGEADLTAAAKADTFSKDNVFCAVYQEQFSGFMAGYAAVKLGYTNLGYLGGMAVPGVKRFGSGFVQGCDAAAGEEGAAVNLKYSYANSFVGDADITAAMDMWYSGDTNIVFACGGGIYTSVAEAAKKAGGKIIGVDVDQAPIIDSDYGAGMTVTSALKGLGETVNTLLGAIKDGKWDEYKGKVQALGLVSGDDPTQNYCQLPMESTQWGDKFTKDDYKALVAKLYSGEIKVSDDISKDIPEVKNIKVDYQDSIK